MLVVIINVAIIPKHPEFELICSADTAPSEMLLEPLNPLPYCNGGTESP